MLCSWGRAGCRPRLRLPRGRAGRGCNVFNAGMRGDVLTKVSALGEGRRRAFDCAEFFPSVTRVWR
eukprot:gene34042-54864_t